MGFLLGLIKAHLSNSESHTVPMKRAASTFQKTMYILCLINRVPKFSIISVDFSNKQLAVMYDLRIPRMLSCDLHPDCVVHILHPGDQCLKFYPT